MSKTVRDAFTMPEKDHNMIQLMLERALKAGVKTNKSELVRAGLLLLNDMNGNLFKQALNNVYKVKTGRKAA